MELLNITITTDDLARNIGRGEALEVILAIDSRIAEEDFTIELLKRLTKSMVSDMSREELAEVLGFSLANQKDNHDKYNTQRTTR
jgi:recombinational DNA repair protein RecR